MLGTSEAWSLSRSSHRPSEPAYYIVDCWISVSSSLTSLTVHTSMYKCLVKLNQVTYIILYITAFPYSFLQITDITALEKVIIKRGKKLKFPYGSTQARSIEGAICSINWLLKVAGLFNPRIFNPGHFNPRHFKPEHFNPSLFYHKLFNPRLFNFSTKISQTLSRFFNREFFNQG